jgi:hypothetical protein
MRHAAYWVAFPLSLVTIGCAGAPARPVNIAEFLGDPPPGCQPLGEVVGQDGGRHDPTPEDARRDAWRKAEKLGATHVQKNAAKTGRTGAYTETYTGIAYRCPGGDAPSAGK